MNQTSAQVEDRIVGIDGCRALACLGVFIVNYMNKVGFDSSQYFLDYREIAGRFGIVTLIVLSGFGLSIPFWRALLEGRRWPSTTHFWVRRFLRIAPLYYVCLVALIVHNEIWRKPDGWTDIILHFFFLYNYSSYFYYSMNPVFWVLAFFMHFYLLLPLLFWMGKGGTKNSLVVMVATILVSYLAHVYLSSLADVDASGAKDLALTKSFFAYLPHFLVGTLAGCLFLACERNSRLSQALFFRWFAFWLLLALLFAGLGTGMLRDLDLPYAVYYFPTTPVLVALILVSAAMGSASAFLESAPIRVLAALSYGIFVFHYPVINVSLRVLPKVGIKPDDNAVLIFFLALFVTACIAAIGYLVVEKPMRAISARFFK